MNFQKKLIGDEEERAVSPVIGVILMVAITVILAAVIAAFVLDLGGSVGEEAQAGVSMEVDESGGEDELSIEITSMGNSDYVTFGGIASELEDKDEPDDAFGDDVDNLSAHEMTTGDAITLNGDNLDEGEEGTVTAIAVIDADDTETQVASVEVDLSYASE
ncbi:type IV pilin [Natrarchaeobaculum sulfurireducens]|uniref:Pilin/Flagellin, FlaG/FlaF family n=1 Tax=Natrarchaeobaculum sulfurireducens TaxID=2044521 RepID=A0A346PMI5_9EURY|nr:type IV pilin N-terminal domain-containing protein [Natrarchaeobaculum sulfurireducens]AXR80730.1 Pilin/Flagellin, FlaG/FlaF family [Natrarchaeobaculum sulfurireducens]